MKQARLKPFPFARLDRIDATDLALLDRCGCRRWLPILSGLLRKDARLLGLGSGGLTLGRVQCIRMEALRAVFPGQWLFAVLSDPVSGRVGFVGIDPLILARLASRLDADRHVLPGVSELDHGERGLVAYWSCRTLVSLSEEHAEFEDWRYLGTLESIGQLGRQLHEDDRVLATWLTIRLGWDRGFAVWLEGERSATRRTAAARKEHQLPATLAELPLLGRRVIGCLEILPAEFMALQLGDVLLLSGVGEGDSIEVSMSGLTIRGQASEDHYSVLNLDSRPGGVEMGEPIRQATPSAESCALIDGGEIPIELRAEMGRLQMTVGQLADLRRGDVLALPDPLLGPVDLRAAGRLVARGELVDVDGRRGVRVTELPWRQEEADETLA